MENRQENYTKKPKRVIIGMIFIIGSIAYGWTGLFVGNALALKYGVFWSVFGGLIYIVSWITYLLGFWLAGSAGIQYAKTFFKKIFGRKCAK